MQKLLLIKGEGRGPKNEKIKEENSNFNIRYLTDPIWETTNLQL